MGRKPSLTRDQVLAAIQRWFAEHGDAPSAEQLRKELRVGSTRTVFRYLRALEEEGTIEREPGAHGLRLLKPQQAGVQTRAIPVVGQVPAGPLLLADENVEGWIRMPKAFATPASDRFFLLHIRGNSMNRARVEGGLIEDGDLVLVRQRTVARPGDIVVALIDGESTVKRFASGAGYSVLKPETNDPRHRQILVDRSFRALGVVVRVFKKGSEILAFVADAPAV